MEWIAGNFRVNYPNDYGVAKDNDISAIKICRLELSQTGILLYYTVIVWELSWGLGELAWVMDEFLSKTCIGINVGGTQWDSDTM